MYTFKVKDGDKDKNNKYPCTQMMKNYQKIIKPFGLRLKT